MTSTLKPLGIEKALQSIASHQTAWEKVVASMQKPLGIEKALQSIASHQTAWEKVVASIRKPSAIEQAVHLINKSSDVFLNRPSIFSEMAESIAELDFRDDFSDEEGDIDELFVEASEQLSSISENHAFIELFRKFPPLLQAFIFFILLHVFLPQINNIASNLITPHIESYLNENDAPNREKINNIKIIPQEIKEVDTKSLRFITGNNVRLRKSPSTKSEILDELILGQVVIVLSKKRNWIKVEYEYTEGEAMIGWVFTRYTAKFKKY